MSFIPDSELRQVDGYPFPVFRDPNAKGSYVERVGKKFYVYPTEPYIHKQNFLLSNRISPQHILTIHGANWPIFYLDTFPDSVQSIHSVDQNPAQIQNFVHFLTDEHAFMMDMLKYQDDDQQRSIDRLLGEAPYLPLISRKKWGKRYQRQNEFQKGDALDTFRALQDRGRKFAIEDGNFSTSICDIERLPVQQLQIDFVDLSNVPEIDGIDLSSLLENLPQGVILYFSSLKGDYRIIQNFIEELQRHGFQENHDSQW